MNSVDTNARQPAPAEYQPSDDGQPRHARLRHSPLFVPLAALAAVLAGLAGSGLLAVRYPELGSTLTAIIIGLLIAAGILLSITLQRIQQRLMTPLSEVRHWARQMCSGMIAARIPEPVDGDFTELARDINSLGAAVEALSMDLDAEVKNRPSASHRRPTHSKCSTTSPRPSMSRAISTIC